MGLFKNFFEDKGRVGVAMVCLLMLSVAMVSGIVGDTYAATTVKATFIHDDGFQESETCTYDEIESFKCSVSVPKSTYGWGTSSTCTSGELDTVSLTKDTTYYECINYNNTTVTAKFVYDDGTSKSLSCTYNDSAGQTSCSISVPSSTYGWGTSSTCTSGYTSSVTLTKSTTFYECTNYNNTTVTAKFVYDDGTSKSLSCTYNDSAGQTSCSISVPSSTYGWGTSSSCSSGYTSSISLTKDTTYYECSGQYVIKFDANGGSGAPNSQIKTHGVDLTLSSTKPTRTGYTFNGWSTSSTATSATYQAGGKYTVNASDTLYAVWSKNSYTISFDANGGSGAPSQVTKEYNSTFTISSTAPTRTGYTFKGWGTTSTTISASYQPGDSYTVKGNATLYAIWDGNPYKVNYNNNGGTGTMSDSNHVYGTASTLSANTFTRTGYTFSGWNTKADGSGTKYADKASVSTLVSTNNGTITLYAQWTANKYTVKYDSNEGNGTMADSSHTYGTASTLTANTFTRTGYTFNGWNTKADGTGTTYNDKASVSSLVSTNNGSITLYAQWKQNGSSSEENPLVTYTVKYNSNGGTGTMTDSEYIVGEQNQLKANTFIRENYTFNGWNTEVDGSGTSYEDKDVIEDANFENDDVIELYAQWVAEETNGDNTGNEDNEGDTSNPPTNDNNSDNENLNKGDNPDTGALATILVSLIGIGAVGGIFFYRKKIKI